VKVMKCERCGTEHWSGQSHVCVGGVLASTAYGPQYDETSAAVLEFVTREMVEKASFAERNALRAENAALKARLARVRDVATSFDRYARDVLDGDVLQARILEVLDDVKGG